VVIDATAIKLDQFPKAVTVTVDGQYGWIPKAGLKQIVVIPAIENPRGTV
jgi:hypothetical protein